MRPLLKIFLPVVIFRLVIYLLVMFFGVSISLFFMSFSLILIVFGLLYFWIMYYSLHARIKATFFMIRLLYIAYKDKERALIKLDSAILDGKDILRIEKTEMDAHRLNMRNEADAIVYSQHSEAAIRANLGIFIRAKECLLASMKQEPSTIYDIELDDYE